MAKPVGTLYPNGRVRIDDGTRRSSEFRGTKTISGTTKIAGSTATCRVYLYLQDGSLIGFRRTTSTGAYSFLGLAPGDYRIVVEQEGQAHRSKVEHVRLT